MAVALLTDEQLGALLEQAAERGAQRAISAVRDDQLLPLSDAARLRGVSLRTIERWVATGRLASLGEGKARRIKRSDLGC